MPTLNTTRRSSGQAAVEFIVCLILLLIVVIGMIHVATMGRASIYIHAAIRGRAGAEAMGGLTLGETPRNISDWEPGPDGIRYTADDRPVARNAGGIADALTERSAKHPDDWSRVDPDSLLSVSAIRLNNAETRLLSLVRGEDTIRIEIPSFIRQFIYDKGSVTVKEEVWMPLMGGLY